MLLCSSNLCPVCRRRFTRVGPLFYNFGEPNTNDANAHDLSLNRYIVQTAGKEPTSTELDEVAANGTVNQMVAGEKTKPELDYLNGTIPFNPVLDADSIAVSPILADTPQEIVDAVDEGDIVGSESGALNVVVEANELSSNHSAAIAETSELIGKSVHAHNANEVNDGSTIDAPNDANPSEARTASAKSELVNLEIGRCHAYSETDENNKEFHSEIATNHNTTQMDIGIERKQEDLNRAIRTKPIGNSRIQMLNHRLDCIIIKYGLTLNGKSFTDREPSHFNEFRTETVQRVVQTNGSGTESGDIVGLDSGSVNVVPGVHAPKANELVDNTATVVKETLELVGENAGGRNANELTDDSTIDAPNGGNPIVVEEAPKLSEPKDLAAE